jgi:hypothetical protein
MPFTTKNKPGMLSRMFNKAQPQPATMQSHGEKTLGVDGEVLDAPTHTAAPSPGLFSSRRAARAASEFIDVDMVAMPEDAEPILAPARKTFSGMFKDRKAQRAPEVREMPESADEDVTRGRSETEADEARSVPPEPAKAPGLFGRKTTAAKPARAKAKGFFSRKAGTASVAEEGGPAIPKQKKAKPAKKGHGPLTSVSLLTELGESGKSLLWTLTSTSLTQLPGTPAPEDVISFSKDDIRFRTHAAMTYGKAQDMAIEEVGEMVSIVNCTKDLNAVYCTRDDRAMASPYRIAAGQQALDLLLLKTERVGQALVTGFFLKDEASATSVVVLYFVSADGESSKPQVTVNPDNMEFVLAQFTSSRKINRKETEQVLFTNEDLLSVASDVRFFANEKVWNGIPVRVLQNAAAGVTGVLAAGAVGWAALGFTQKQVLIAKAATMQSRTSSLTEKNSKLIESSLYSFSTQLSQDPARVVTLAQTVWVPTAKVTVESKMQELAISVVLPLVNSATYNNGPSVNAVTDAVHVRQLYDKEAPEGCTKSQPQTTGNLNEIRIDIICQAPDSPFYGYRGD